MFENFIFPFIKNNPYLSAAIGAINLYFLSLIPGETWLLLFFIAALIGESNWFNRL